MREGGSVEHIFFDCGGGGALAFLPWQEVPGVPREYDSGIKRGPGVPAGTFHCAFRSPTLAALEPRPL